MVKKSFMLAFVMVIAVVFSTVYAHELLTVCQLVAKQTAPAAKVEDVKANEAAAPAPRVRNIQRVGVADPEAQTQEEPVREAREAAEQVNAVAKDPNDKRAQLNGYWQMENTNWGLWINYEFTGDDAEMTFDYSGPMGFWDGSYRVISYDGNTVKLENKEEADEPIFTFNVKLNNNKLVVSNLGNSLHTTHLRHHNGTYSIVEE